MAWAYRDEDGILHVVEDEKTAKKYSRDGKIVKTDIPNQFGFPVFPGDVIYDYGDEIYVGGNRKDGRKDNGKAAEYLKDIREALK